MSIPREEWGHCPGCPGWDGIMEALSACICRELDKQGGYIDVSDIKEKFGGLRFYYYSNTDAVDEIDKLVDAAEQLTERTCQWCGEYGKKRTVRGWVSALCDACYENKCIPWEQGK